MKFWFWQQWTPGQNRVKDPHLYFSPLLIFIFLSCAMDEIVNGVKKYWKRSFFGIEFESSRCCNIACVRVTHRHKTKQFHQSSQNNFPHGLGFPLIYQKLFSYVSLAYSNSFNILWPTLHFKQGNYSLRRPPKLIIPQAVIRHWEKMSICMHIDV